MKVNDVLIKLTLIEKQITSQKKNDPKTKFQIISLFKDVKKYMSYRIPMEPLKLDDDGKIFRCPRCNTVIEAEEGTVNDFDLCYVCGQLFRELEETNVNK